MTGSDGSGDWTRRKALVGMAATTAAFVVPKITSAGAADEFHLEIMHRVRKLVKGKKPEIRILLPQGSAANVGPVIAAFKAGTGVEIRVSETSVEEVNTEFTLDALSKSNKYDIALPATFGIPDLAAAKAILPLTTLAKRHEPPGFRNQILYNVGDSFDGRPYGFQTDGDAYVMFYNKGFMQNPEESARYEDTYGVTLALPDTWAELDRQMAYFTRFDDQIWGGALFRSPGYLAWEWWVRFHSKGIWPFSPEMEPQIASDAGVEALEELIRATENQCREARSMGLFENWERYSKGDIYCNVGWGGSQKYLNGVNSKMRGNMIYGKMPGGIIDGKLLVTPYFNWGWNYVVSANTALPELSYLFALFASTPEISTMAVRQKDGFFDPYRPEHYQDLGIQAAYSTEFLEIHRASLENAIPDLYLKGQGEYFRLLNDGLALALERELHPEKALQRVAIRWRLITKSMGLEKQIERWARLRNKYPKHIRRLLKDLM